MFVPHTFQIQKLTLILSLLSPLGVFCIININIFPKKVQAILLFLSHRSSHRSSQIFGKKYILVGFTAETSSYCDGPFTLESFFL